MQPVGKEDPPKGRCLCGLVPVTPGLTSLEQGHAMVEDDAWQCSRRQKAWAVNQKGKTIHISGGQSPL